MFIFNKKRRLRHRSRTKNTIFHQKKAPAATFQDQKRNFSPKKGACGNVPTPKTHFLTKRRLRQRSRTKKTCFFTLERRLRLAETQQKNSIFFTVVKFRIETKEKTNISKMERSDLNPYFGKYIGSDMNFTTMHIVHVS